MYRAYTLNFCSHVVAQSSVHFTPFTLNGRRNNMNRPARLNAKNTLNPFRLFARQAQPNGVQRLFCKCSPQPMKRIIFVHPISLFSRTVPFNGSNVAWNTIQSHRFFPFETIARIVDSCDRLVKVHVTNTTQSNCLAIYTLSMKCVALEAWNVFTSRLIFGSAICHMTNSH